MHKLESVQEDETHKTLRNFETQTDHLIPARRLDLVIINCIVNFSVPADPKMKIKEDEEASTWTLPEN